MPTTPRSSSELDSTLAARIQPRHNTLESVADANANAAELLVDLELARCRLEEQNQALDQARREAEASAQCKATFLATMSHELRTPLNSIIGYSEILLEDAEAQGSASMSHDLKRIGAAGRHLLDLINGILDFSKIEAGHMTVHPERISIEPLLREVSETILPLTRKNGNHLSIHCPDPAPAVQADPLRVTQCLLNMLSNAARFTSSGSIALAVQAAGDGKIALSVADTGIGIDPALLQHLFEPFTQADGSDARIYGGTGLGLAISRRLARLMDGDLVAESSPGNGSTFTLLLPVAADIAPAGQ